MYIINALVLCVTGYYEFLCPLAVYSRFLIKNRNLTNLVYILFIEILIYDRNEVTCNSPYINYRYELGNMVLRHIFFSLLHCLLMGGGWVGLGEANTLINLQLNLQFSVESSRWMVTQNYQYEWIKVLSLSLMCTACNLY